MTTALFFGECLIISGGIREGQDTLIRFWMDLTEPLSEGQFQTLQQNWGYWE